MIHNVRGCPLSRNTRDKTFTLGNAGYKLCKYTSGRGHCPAGPKEHHGRPNKLPYALEGIWRLKTACHCDRPVLSMGLAVLIIMMRVGLSFWEGVGGKSKPHLSTEVGGFSSDQ
jgi:hypothetical protein